MEELNSNCLENRDGNVKNVLLLSQNYKNISKVVEQFWKRISRIEIAKNSRRAWPTLSGKEFLDIMEHVLTYITEIEIKDCVANSVKLGDQCFNLADLGISDILAIFEANPEHLLKANLCHPAKRMEVKFFNAFLKHDSNLEELTLTLDKDLSFFPDVEIASLKKLTLIIKKNNCAVCFRKVKKELFQI